MINFHNLFDWQNKELKPKSYFLPLGINVGNNATKAFVNPDLHLNGRILLPSRLAIRNSLPHTVGSINSRTNSVFGYVGSDPEYSDKFILLGSENTGEGSEELGKNPGRKIEEILVLVLAVVNKVLSNSSLDAYSHFQIPLFLSVPNKNQDVADKVNGEHKILLNGDGRQVTVDLTVKKVLTESQAASVLLNSINQQERIAVIDFGNGTTISSATASSGLSLMHSVEFAGVRSLIEEIRHSGEAQKFNGQNPVGYSYIQNALEQGKKSITIPGVGGWDFSTVYDRELDRWFNARLKEFSDLMKNKDLAVADLYAIGGGSLLPDIDEKLESMKIKTIEDPQFIDAIALAWLANKFAQPSQKTSDKSKVKKQASPKQQGTPKVAVSANVSNSSEGSEVSHVK